MAKVDLELYESTGLDEAIHRTVGFASVCWSDMKGTGVFKSEDAHEAALQLKAWIEERYVEKDS